MINVSSKRLGIFIKHAPVRHIKRSVRELSMFKNNHDWQQSEGMPWAKGESSEIGRGRIKVMYGYSVG